MTVRKRSPGRTAGVAIRRFFLFVAPCLMACGGSGANDGDPPEITPPPSSPEFTTATLGYLPGDNQGFGMAVNNAGHVAGWSADGAGATHAFYWDGILRNLSPAGVRGAAYGINNGSPVYVAGYREIQNLRQAVIWSPATSSEPVVIESNDSHANDVNDAGTAVGRYRVSASLTHAAMWPLSQGRIDIPPLPGHTSTTANAINNQGIVVGTSFGAGGETTNKAWVRLASGQVLELAPVDDDLSATAAAVSDVVSGQFTVVGYDITAAGIRRAVRWTVNATTGTMTKDLLTGLREAWGVASSGAVAGSTTTQSVIWRNGVSLALSPAGSTGFSRGIATSATGASYVVGTSGSPAAAVLWTVR